MTDVVPHSDREMFGKLGTVGLNDIIQLLGMTRRTATLELRRGADLGRIYFREGQVVHAEAGSYEGEECILELLGWSDAVFALDDGIDSLPRVTISKSTDALLLCTATALDETARVLQQLSEPEEEPPARRAVPRPRPTQLRAHRQPAVVAAVVLTAISIVAPLASSPDARALLDARTLTPWSSLPEFVSSRGLLDRTGFTLPDPWTVAEDVWSREVVPVSPPAVEAETLAATTAPNGVGYLTIVAEPWARVFVDGEPRGETPLAQLSLPAGEHTVTLVNDHVVGVIRGRVSVVAEEATLARYSFNDVGYVRLVATPWADVSIDGRPVGQTPMARIEVPAGEHVVRFAHPQLGTTERVASVGPGETATVKVELGTAEVP